MLREMLDPNPSIDEAQLTSFESFKDLRLPSAYREFLLRNNGGQPVPAAFSIRGFANNPVGVVQAFFGLNATIRSEDLMANISEFFHYFPKQVLPIACTGCGDLVCLDLREDSEKVVFWDSKPSWGNNVWSERDLYFIAPDFGSFLAALTDYQ